VTRAAAVVAASGCLHHRTVKTKLLASRYRIVRKIGAGGMSEVFEAVDTRYDLRVAVKAIRRAEGFSLLRFKEEFRGLADLRHRNLVRLHDLMFHDDRWFITMELVDGVDLVTHVDALDTSGDVHSLESSHEDPAEQRLAVSGELRRLLGEIASALQYLHDSGVVHRDIKPTNILVDAMGRPCILDFGIARYLRAADEIREALKTRKVGTPGYVAPEQIRGRAIPASDVYSLGVILYRVLTGRLPFTGRKKDVLVAHLSRDPVPPSDLVEDVDPELSALAMRMLRKRPRERPTVDELRRLCERDRSVQSIEIGPTPQAPPPSPFVGRLNEQRRVLARILEAPLGGPVMVCLQGPSGIGKTRLADEVAAQARERGMRSLYARCYEREQIPYKALDAVVDQAISYVISAGEGDLLLQGFEPDSLVALARLFPFAAELKLGDGTKVSDLVASADAPLHQQAAFETLTRLLAVVAGTSGLLLVLDDLQWADDGSFELLRHLVRQRGERFAVLATLRPAEGALPVWITNGSAESQVKLDRVELGPIAREDAEVLLDSIAERMPPSVMDQVVAEAGGNPVVIEEFVRYYTDFTDSPGDEVVTFGEMLRRRLASLDERSRAVVEVCVAAGHALDLDAIAAGARLKPQEAGFAAVGLVEQRLVRPVAGREGVVRLFPFHDRGTTVILDGMEPVHRRRIHRRLASHFAATRPEDFHALADHWRLAGVPEKAASYALRAAEHAESVQLLGRAVRYYARALACPPGGLEEWQIRERMARVLDRSGRFHEAGRAFGDAARRAPKDVRSGLYLRRAAALLKAEQTSTAVRTMEQLTRLLWDEPLVLPRWRVVSGIAAEYLGARPWVPSRLLPLAAPTVDSTELCIELAGVTRNLMPLRATHLTARALRMARQHGEPTMVARGLVAVAATLAVLGNPLAMARSRSLLGTAEALFGVDPNVAGMGNLHGVRAVLGRMECRWGDMRASLRRALEAFLAEGTPSSWHAQMVRVQCVLGEVEAGNLAAAEAQSLELLAPDASFGDPELPGWVRWARVRVELAFQRWGEAEQLCRMGLRNAASASDASRPLWLRFRAGLAASLSGRGVDAAALTCLDRTLRVVRRRRWLDPLGRAVLVVVAAGVLLGAAQRQQGRARARLLARAARHAGRLQRAPHRQVRPRGTAFMAEVAQVRGRSRRALQLSSLAVDRLLASQQRLEGARALRVQAEAEASLGLAQAEETRRAAAAQLAAILRRGESPGTD